MRTWARWVTSHNNRHTQYTKRHHPPNTANSTTECCVLSRIASPLLFIRMSAKCFPVVVECPRIPKNRMRASLAATQRNSSRIHYDPLENGRLVHNAKVKCKSVISDATAFDCIEKMYASGRSILEVAIVSYFQQSSKWFRYS